MSEDPQSVSNETEAPAAPPAGTEDSSDTANLIYILHLASILLGITALVGLIMAYINRKDAQEWLQTHYTYQIHTFWKGMLYSVVGLVLTVVLIGFLVILFVLVWWIIRCVKGMKALKNKQPIENPTSWMF